MKKKDMYIRYERSYKRRRRHNNGTVKILLGILLFLILGSATFVTLKIQADKKEQKNEVIPDQIDSGEDDGAGDDQQSSQPQATPEAKETFKTDVKSGLIDQTTPQQDQASDRITVIPDSNEEKKPTQVKGIYVSAKTAGSNYINTLTEVAATTELNAMVIDVKDDTGRITFDMNSPTVQKIGSDSNDIKDMPELIRTLKKKNIYLIARIVAFKDPYLAEYNHKLAIKNKDGSLYRDNNGECWVNPYEHEVWDYLLEVASQAASLGFDEIQFDYIRFSTGGDMSKVDFGKASKTKSKEDIITEFTKYAYESLKPLGVYVSADVYGAIISSDVDGGIVGQNYVEMAKYLDYICPMIYPSHFGNGNYGIKNPDLEPYEIIRKVLTASASRLGDIPEGQHRAIVRPWLQDFTATWLKPHIKYGKDEIRQQIEGVYSVNYNEWLLWNSVSKYSVEGLLKE